MAQQSATRSTESIVIAKPLQAVWNEVKACDLKFWKAVKGASIEGEVNSVGTSTRQIEYVDGSSQLVRLVELSELTWTASWEVVSASPPTPYLAVIHTITVQRVTADNTSFVTWMSEFSSSAGEQELAVTEDSKYKRKEALGDLKQKLEGKN